MAQIQWKQISPHLSGSGNLTGSLNVTGSLTLNGQPVALASVSGGYAILEGGNNFTGPQTINGNLSVTGDITAERFYTEFTSASIIFESGSSLFGNSLDDTHQFTGSILGTGSLIFNGDVEFLNYPWPAVGSERHFLKTQPYSIVFNGVSRSYDYHGIALEHIEDSTNIYHNSLTLYTFDNHENADFGGEINIGPIRTHIRQYASGSSNLANISVEEISNGRTRALMYGEDIQIGAFKGENIRLGNTGSTLHFSGALDLGLNGIDQYFSVNIGNISQFKVTNSGSLQLASKNEIPSALAGGLFYSASDEFYLGFIS